MTSHPLIADLCNSVESLRTSGSDTIKVLKKRKVNVERDILFARKEWNPSGLFDQNYWSRAAKIERSGLTIT
ncbi:unnamed protein product [Penicillium camemberti]|uniref:Str. FM013 n=1 Tax=Penicillium camemberti (strain FM 013) TaxID=1429867 RepID=A0A0G4PJK9_PENC3|nr:unnamed protein product [Penicillium camemberti]